ncbi:MAG: SDR family NAD(P)-dependent oxidoreductase [Ilumatobacteraceae bacterium]
MVSRGSLDGRVAVVTGGGGGIGRAVATVLAQQGAAVVVNDLGAQLDGSDSDASVAQQVADSIVAAGGRAIANHDSVGSFAGAERIVAAATDTYGRLDQIVLCAGNSAQVPPQDMTEEFWDLTMQIHLKGHFACMRASMEPMRSTGGGSIVAITSHVGLYGLPDAPAYCAAKSGITGLTKSMAQACEPLGITVNCVAPSAVTRMSDTVPVDILRQRAAAAGITLPDGMSDDEIRLLLIGDPVAVANFIAYLGTDAARQITGQTFAVIGGHVGVFAPWTETGSVDNTRPWTIDELEQQLPTILSGVSVGR